MEGCLREQSDRLFASSGSMRAAGAGGQQEREGSGNMRAAGRIRVAGSGENSGERERSGEWDSSRER